MSFGLSNIVSPFEGSDSEIFGTKPIIPDYPTLADAQKQAIANDKSSLPDLQDLTSKVNTFNQGELERMLKERIPGLDSINQNASNVINSELKGQLPPDVQALIERKTAEKSFAGGFSGSGMHANLSARDLGLTSLQLTQTGLSSADRWLANVRQTQVAPLHDVTSMFVSPAQQFAANEGKYQRDLSAATVAAAPDPAKRGRFDSDMAVVGMILSAYGGGAGYQGTYKPQNPSGDYYRGNDYSSGGGWESYGSTGQYSGMGNAEGANQGSGEGGFF